MPECTVCHRPAGDDKLTLIAEDRGEQSTFAVFCGDCRVWVAAAILRLIGRDVPAPPAPGDADLVPLLSVPRPSPAPPTNVEA